MTAIEQLQGNLLDDLIVQHDELTTLVADTVAAVHFKETSQLSEYEQRLVKAGSAVTIAALLKLNYLPGNLVGHTFPTLEAIVQRVEHGLLPNGRRSVPEHEEALRNETDRGV